MSAPQANDRDKPLIRRDLVAIRVGGGRALLLEPGTATAHELPEAAAAAILSCRCFDSLAGHAARIRRNNDLPPNSDVRLEAELERAVAAGLFATWTDTWTNVAGRDGPRASDVRIDRVAVATRDRPVALARALQSHFALARAAGRTMRAHVVDSSPTEASAAHSRTAALAIAQEAGFPVRYANLSDRNDFVGRLARRADVDPDLVRFALSDLHGCGSDVGANRNALLLGHVGRVFL
ncbi:MAG TPA: hypothetical protein VGG33_28465, partial [Polyangia bacterium]